MQRQMEEGQKELETKEFTASAGGGAVEVTVTGKKEVVKVKLTEEVVDPDDIEMLQDLIVAATNEALKNNIAELFTNVDVTDARSVNAAVERYKELMRPAYIAYGMNDTHGSLTKVLNQDAANFKAQISGLLAAVNYKATDYRA